MNRRHFFEVTIGGLVATWAVPVLSSPSQVLPMPVSPAAHALLDSRGLAGCVLSNLTQEPIEATILASNGDILSNPIVAAQSNFLLDLSLFSPEIFPLSVITGRNAVKMTAWGYQ